MHLRWPKLKAKKILLHQCKIVSYFAIFKIDTLIQVEFFAQLSLAPGPRHGTWILHLTRQRSQIEWILHLTRKSHKLSKCDQTFYFAAGARRATEAWALEVGKYEHNFTKWNGWIIEHGDKLTDALIQWEFESGGWWWWWWWCWWWWW